MMSVIDDFNVSRYGKEVGSMRSAQLAVKFYMDDMTNLIEHRGYAKRTYIWLSSVECTIDELFSKSSNMSIFILNALIKYEKIFEALLDREHYPNAVSSLSYQYKLAIDK
jgi:hypothetical protein